MTRSHLPRRGASAIEFALCLPFVVTLLAGIIDGGLHLATLHAVSRAARDAARVGASTNEPMPADGTEIIAAAVAAGSASMVGAGFLTGDYTVSASWPADQSGLRWIDVIVTGNQTSLFGNLTPFSGTLRQEFMMVTQEQP